MLHPIYALRASGHSAEYNAVLANSALTDFLESLKDGEQHYFRAIREMALHLYGEACRQAGKTHFLDKTPRYYLIIPELAKIFPKAKFVFLYRNPLAILASYLNTYVKGHWPILASYQQDLITAVDLLLTGARFLGDRVATVHYEELVVNPAHHVERICTHLNIAFSPQMLDYGQFSPPSGKMGDSQNINQFSRVTTQSLNRWIELTHDHQTKHFALMYLQALGPQVIAELGYNYEDIKTQIDAISPSRGKIEYTWQALFEPDAAFQERLYLIELARLEHRRLVHAWHKLTQRIIPQKHD
jgi:hypothetical protein